MIECDHPNDEVRYMNDNCAQQQFGLDLLRPGYIREEGPSVTPNNGEVHNWQRSI